MAPSVVVRGEVKSLQKGVMEMVVPESTTTRKVGLCAKKDQRKGAGSCGEGCNDKGADEWCKHLPSQQA